MFKSKLIFLSLFLGPLLFAGNKIKESPGHVLAALLFFTIAGICISIGLIAIQLLYSVLRPQIVREGSDYSRQKPLKLFFLGLALSVLFMVIIFILDKLPGEPIKALGALVAIIFYAFIILRGLTMITHNIGDKILSSMNSKYAGSSFVSVLAGAIIFCLVGFVPFVGWFIHGLILMVAMGVGFICLKQSTKQIEQ